jgi:hypothetical protein
MRFITRDDPIVAVHRAIGCGQKNFKLAWRCHQLLSGFLVNGHLPRVSYQSRPSANDMGDNEVILGAVHRSPGIYLTAEENPGNQLGDRLVKCCATNHRLKWGSLPPNEVGRIAQHVREEKEGKKGRTGFDPSCTVKLFLPEIRYTITPGYYF